MKISINVFDVGELELHVEREPDGTAVVTKAFYAFLNRPLRPHLSFFSEPQPGRSYLEPHFTAARRTPREFREPLARIQQASLSSGLTHFTKASMTRLFAGLQPADLDGMAAEGWTVHYVNARAIRRWISMATCWKVDDQVIASLARHVLQHAASPLVLKDQEPGMRREFPALRFDDSGELRACFLLHFPLDVPVAQLLDGEGLPETLPAGWYTMGTPVDQPAGSGLSDVVPGDRLRAIGDRVRTLLTRYPLRRTPLKLEAIADDLPSAFSSLFGLYATDLLHCMMELKEERLRTG